VAHLADERAGVFVADLSKLQFYTTLKALHKPVELVLYADEGHIKNQPRHRYEIYERWRALIDIGRASANSPSPGEQK
jgi:dipeptidyl aminopeptidase/acylaminoacyl peptidase